jgi:hypothetical protein
MDDFYTLPEELRAEYEAEYSEWLDGLELDKHIDEDENSVEKTSSSLTMRTTRMKMSRLSATMIWSTTRKRLIVSWILINN